MGSFAAGKALAYLDFNLKKQVVASNNFYDVLIRIVDALYNLTNNGNFVGVVILCVLAYVFYVTGKVSQGFFGSHHN